MLQYISVEIIKLQNSNYYVTNVRVDTLKIYLGIIILFMNEYLKYLGKCFYTHKEGTDNPLHLFNNIVSRRQVNL